MILFILEKYILLLSTDLHIRVDCSVRSTHAGDVFNLHNIPHACKQKLRDCFKFTVIVFFKAIYIERITIVHPVHDIKIFHFSYLLRSSYMSLLAKTTCWQNTYVLPVLLHIETIW